MSRTLRGIGRPPIVHNGERRFLATLLREGGLPAYIGDIASLVVDRVTEIGWDAVSDAAASTWVVARVQQSATGSARRLLDTSEGRVALADFLADAARARTALLDAGKDLRSLRLAAEVKAALEGCGINLPSVENQALLVAVLGSFGTERAPAPAHTAPFRLVASTRQGRVQFALRVALDALDLDEVLPPTVTHATLTAERSRRLLERDASGFVDAASRERVVDFVRDARRGPTPVDVRFAAGGGALRVAPLGTLEWPAADALWFGADGEVLVEERNQLQPGESFLVVAWDERKLGGTGAIEVRDLQAPSGAARAFAVDVRGAGTLLVQTETEERELPSRDKRLDVAVFGTRPPEGITASGLVRELPDLAVADGIEVDVYVRTAGDSADHLVRKGARARIALSSERALRSLAGKVRIRLASADDRVWSASWCVFPRGFEVRSRAGTVVVRPAGTNLVRVDPGRMERRGEDVVVTPPPGAHRVDLFVSLGAGEALRIPVEVASAPVRLWRDATGDSLLPLDGSAQLTERDVYSGACLELDAQVGAELTLATPRGDTALSMRQPGARRALLPLHELAGFLQRANEAHMRFVARVDGFGEFAFKVHIPRLTRPQARTAGGAIEFDYAVDELDVPTNPGIALFPICPPIAGRAVVGCTFDRIGSGKFQARLGPEQAPTAQGRYVAFLVDRGVQPERPMSAGRGVTIPLDLRVPPCPDTVKGLDRALWTRSFESAAAEINAKVGTPDLVSFLGAFAATTPDRARYGLASFDLYTIVAERCPWVLLAALIHVPAPERSAWLAHWPQQIPGFSWLRFKRSDADRLVQALPSRPSEDRMALLNIAKAAHPMERIVEYMMMGVLFAGPSRQPVVYSRQNEMNLLGLNLRSWDAFQLPQSPAGRRWLTGVDLDGDLLAGVEQALRRQLCFGGRARAVRDLFKAREIPHHAPLFEPPSSSSARRLLESLDTDWRPIANTQLSHQIKSLEREIAIATMFVVAYQNGLRDLASEQFMHILDLQRRSPDLFDYWLLAAEVLVKEAS